MHVADRSHIFGAASTARTVFSAIKQRLRKSRPAPASSKPAWPTGLHRLNESHHMHAFFSRSSLCHCGCAAMPRDAATPHRPVPAKPQNLSRPPHNGQRLAKNTIATTRMNITTQRHAVRPDQSYVMTHQSTLMLRSLIADDTRLFQGKIGARRLESQRMRQPAQTARRAGIAKLMQQSRPRDVAKIGRPTWIST